VEVKISGLHVIVKLIDLESWRTSQLMSSISKLNLIENFLQELIKKASKQTQNYSSAKKGYLNGLIEKIIDNFQIVLSDVHIRFED